MVEGGNDEQTQKARIKKEVIGVKGSIIRKESELRRASLKRANALKRDLSKLSGDLESLSGRLTSEEYAESIRHAENEYIREVKDRQEQQRAKKPCVVYALLLKSGNSDKYYIYVGMSTNPQVRWQQHIDNEGTVASQHGMLLCAIIDFGYERSIPDGLRKETQMTNKLKGIFDDENVQGGGRCDVKSGWFDQQGSGFGQELIEKYFKASVGVVVGINTKWERCGEYTLATLSEITQIERVEKFTSEHNMKDGSYRRSSGFGAGAE